LLDLLLPFLSGGKRYGGVGGGDQARRAVLATCAALLARVPDRARYAGAAARQLSLPGSPAARSATCALIEAVGGPLAVVAAPLRGMNAWALGRLGEYDFDRRLAAYGECSVDGFLSKIPPDAIRALASQAL
jgi:hypothetical protein